MWVKRRFFEVFGLVLAILNLGSVLHADVTYEQLLDLNDKIISQSGDIANLQMIDVMDLLYAYPTFTQAYSDADVRRASASGLLCEAFGYFGQYEQAIADEDAAGASSAMFYATAQYQAAVTQYQMAKALIDFAYWFYNSL